MTVQALRGPAALAASCLFTLSSFAGDDPHADQITSYEIGSNANPAYLNPLTALGAPERTSGEIFGLLDVVSVFSPPYGTDELVAIGAGGHLTVQFDQPITNDPNNLYGIDLLIFGNTFFIDQDWPAGIVNGYVGQTGGAIEVSADGKQWELVPELNADALFPRVGYSDSGPYDHVPGAQPTDFTRPVDPTLTLEHFMTLSTSTIAVLYRGSGGGIGVDLDDVGMQQISFVRISLPSDAPDDILIDGFSDVSPRLPGDVTLDGHVDVDDLLEVINGWGVSEPGGPPADFNLDGQINVDDLLVLINNWN